MAELRQGQVMTQAEPIIIVVDDDPGIRDALGSLLRSVGLQVRLLASVPEFLETGRPAGPTCLVLDVRLPGKSRSPPGPVWPTTAFRPKPP